jgi:hypothetical protein
MADVTRAECERIHDELNEQRKETVEDLTRRIDKVDGRINSQQWSFIVALASLVAILITFILTNWDKWQVGK